MTDVLHADLRSVMTLDVAPGGAAHLVRSGSSRPCDGRTVLARPVATTPATTPLLVEPVGGAR